MADAPPIPTQHGKLKELMSQLSRQLGPAAAAANAEAVRDIVNRIDRALNAHLASADAALYPRLMADRRPEVNETARRFQREMGGLKKTFSDYSDKWSRADIASQPTNFRRETQSVIAALSGRLQREEQELYPLAVPRKT